MIDATALDNHIMGTYSDYMNPEPEGETMILCATCEEVELYHEGQSADCDEHIESECPACLRLCDWCAGNIED